MNRLALLGLCTLALAALPVCGTSPASTTETKPETNCVDGIDNDNNGLIDCADPNCAGDLNCVDKSAHCKSQLDCGNIVDSLNTFTCLNGRCNAPGPTCSKKGDPSARCQKAGDPVPTDVQYDVTFLPPFGMNDQSKPRSVVVRFFLSQALDGTTLDCDGIAALAGDGMQYDPKLLDENTNLNMAYRYLYDINWTSGREFSWTDEMVTKASGVIFYAEAWYGPKAEGKFIPSGKRAATYCAKTPLDLVNGESPFPMKFSFTPPAG